MGWSAITVVHRYTSLDAHFCKTDVEDLRFILIVDDVEVVDDTLISASEPIQRERGEPRHLAKGTLIITTTSTIIIKKKRKHATHSKTKSGPQDTPDDKLYNIPRVLSNSR